MVGRCSIIEFHALSLENLTSETFILSLRFFSSLPYLQACCSVLGFLLIPPLSFSSFCYSHEISTKWLSEQDLHIVRT